MQFLLFCYLIKIKKYLFRYYIDLTFQDLQCYCQIVLSRSMEEHNQLLELFKHFLTQMQGTFQEFKNVFKKWDQESSNEINKNQHKLIFELIQNKKIEFLLPSIKNLYQALKQTFQNYLMLINEQQNSRLQNRNQQYQSSYEDRSSFFIQSQQSDRTLNASQLLPQSFASQNRTQIPFLQNTIRLGQNYFDNSSIDYSNQKTRLQTQLQLSQKFKKINNLNLSILDSSFAIALPIQKQKKECQLNFQKVLQNSKFDQESFFQQNKSYSILMKYNQLQQKKQKQQYAKKIEEQLKMVKYDQKKQKIKLEVYRNGVQQQILIGKQQNKLNWEELSESVVTNNQLIQVFKLMKQWKLQQIKYVYLGYTSIEDVLLQQIVKEMQNLEQLYLNSCKQINNFKIVNCKQLKWLDLSYSTIENFRLQQLQNLEYLNLQSCKKLNKLKIANCEKLEKLSLKSTTITDLQLQQMSNLEQLDLSGCKQLNKLKITNIKILKKLSLRHTNLSDNELEQLLMQLPELQSLDLSFCNNVYFFLDFLNSKLLKKINLYNSSVSSQRIQKLRKHFPSLAISKEYIFG